MIVHCLDLTHWLLILPKAGCCLVAYIAYSWMLIGCIPCLKLNDDWLLTLPIKLDDDWLLTLPKA